VVTNLTGGKGWKWWKRLEMVEKKWVTHFQLSTNLGP
jgi:hypothetical protein